MLKHFLIISFFFTMVSASPLQKQDYNTVDKKGEIAQYTASDQKALMMNVNIWGEVKYPGQYLIPYTMNINIMSLISLAGGPTPDANLKKVVLIRMEDNPENSGKAIVDMDDFFKAGNLSEIPELGPNDTVIINKTFVSRLNSNHNILNVLQLIVTVYLIING